MENNMTASNLRSAYGGESQAYMRYRQWGNHAENEGFSNVARLFEVDQMYPSFKAVAELQNELRPKRP